MDFLEHACDLCPESEAKCPSLCPRDTPPATDSTKSPDATPVPEELYKEKTLEPQPFGGRTEPSDTDIPRKEQKASEPSAGAGDIKSGKHKDEEILVRRVFTAQTEEVGHSRIHKWLLFQQENAEDLVRNIANLHKTINVIGVYGSTHQSLRLIQQLIQYEKELALPPDEENEGIIAYFRPKINVLCFFYKISSEQIYESKPYPSTSHEAVYVKLLFDLCPLVVCCISDSMQQNWHSATEFQLANPFQPSIQKSLVLRIGKRKVGSYRVEELTVVNDCRDGEGLHISADRSNLMFTLIALKERLTFPAPNALKELKAWLNDRKNDCIEHSTMHAYSSYFGDPDFAVFLFNSLDTALRSLKKHYPAILTTIKSKYKQMKDELSSAPLVAYEEFLKLLLEKYQFALITERDKLAYNGWYETKVSYEDVMKRLKDLFVTKVDYCKGCALSSDFEELLVSCAESPDDSIQSARESLRTFFKTQCDLLQAKRESLIEDKYSALEAELAELIRQCAYSQTTEIYSLKTLSFSMNGNQLTVQQTGIESKVCLPLLTTHVQFHALDQSNAFLLSESENHYLTVKFNPSSDVAGNVKELFLLQSDILIASGSTGSLMAWFSNGPQQARYGAAIQFQAGRGVPLQVYGERVNQVLSACLLQKARKLLLINEAGELFSMELVGREQQLELVISPNTQTTSEQVQLTPIHGFHFYDVKCSDDETLFFLLTDTEIEVHASNFAFITAIPIESPFVSYKVLTIENSIIVVTLTGNSVSAYRLWSESESVENCVVEPDKELVAGNPVIDILYYSILKYGNSAHFRNRKPTFYLYADKREKKCEKYLHSISVLGQHITVGKSVTPSTLTALQREFVSSSFKMKVEKVKWQLFTRSPLQSCAFQGGNLVPLHSGDRTFDRFVREVSDNKADFVTACMSFFQLGSLEPIISAAKNIKVISIIGKSGSGKSHLLNRLFGTCFDVAVNGCTDGIWVSISKIQGETFCILDCEGFPSEHRSMQEEVKVCLLLAAISDVMIINQGMASIRSLSALFERFDLACGRAKGSNLFKGRLEIAIRNVAAHQDEKVISEVKEFIRSSIAAHKSECIMKLFGGELMYSSYHDCGEETLFAAEATARRQFYSASVPSRWQSGTQFLLSFKATFAHIYADDPARIDTHVFQFHLSDTMSKLKKAIGEQTTIKEIVAPENPSVAYTFFIADGSFPIEIELFDVAISVSTSYLVFDTLLEEYAPASLRSSHHKEWYEALNGFVRYYFAIYKTVVLGYLDRSIEVTSEMKPMFEEIKESLEALIDSTLVRLHTVSLRKCRNCGLCCKLVQNHSGDSLTDSHSLGDRCSCLRPEKCLPQTRTTESNLRRNSHICSDSCSTANCKNKSTSATACPGGQPRALLSVCERTCEVDQSMPHDLHNCGQKNCQLPCDSSTACMSEDDVHCLREERGSPSDATEVSVHFCSEALSCSRECTKDGICELVTVSEVREREMETACYPYLYVVQRAVKRRCRWKLPTGSISHTGDHICEIAVHTCPHTCPDCGAYCELVFGHSGVHSSAAHRSKDTSKDTSKEIGESCDESCMRKGRGHVHAVPCGTDCLRVTQVGLAVHSDGKVYDFDRKYILVECGAYWKLKGWEPPVLRKSSWAQHQFSLCPFYCTPTEGTGPVYCEGQLFHTNSTAHKDHQFTACVHQSVSEYDIALIFNCAGSVSSNFLQVRDAIAKVNRRYGGKELTVMFAVVCYAGQSMPCQRSVDTSPADPQIAIYPPSCQLKDFDPTAASSFLVSANSSGRGLSKGKGLFDELCEANRLIWRQKSNRLCVIIAEDCRDCGIFHSHSDHTAMDSCDSHWESLFAAMKSSKTEIKLLKIHSVVDTTAELFQMKYEEGFECVSIMSARSLSTAVEESIAKFINQRFELVVGYNKSV